MMNEFKHYGLQGGQVISIRPKELDPPGIALSVNTSAPWTWAEHKAKVVQETPYFVTVEIQPIYNKHGYGWSRPYNVAVHKHDIATGQIIVRDVAGERIR